MESANNLEIKGSLQTNPPAELLREINSIRFSGALRLSNETHKIVVYFDNGETIFAVSNARQHRLYEILMQTRKITKDRLTAITDFTNDLVLRKNLLENNLLDKAEIDEIFKQQIGDVLQTAVNWNTGEWIFSPLVRLKSDVSFQIDLKNILINYGRSLSGDTFNQKFKNGGESFIITGAMPAGVNPTPHESFVYSRFERASQTLDEIRILSGLPEIVTFQIIYNLWLGGFLDRQDWNSAFSKRYVAAVSTAKLSIKKDEPKPVVQPPVKKSRAAH